MQNLRLRIDLSRRVEHDYDYVLFGLQQVSNHLSRLAASVDLNVFNEVQTSLDQIMTVLGSVECNWQPICLDVNTGGLVGHPNFEISKDQLQYYDLKISDITEALGGSRSTIKRCLREYRISISERQTDISDAELDIVV